MTKKRIAVFASGNGTNAQKIFEHFKDNPTIQVHLLLSNKADAYVLERAKSFNIQAATFNRADFYQTENVVRVLKDHHIDLVVLAGFMWLVPKNLVNAFPQAIVNIHPALLPKYGGKGMYGSHVHHAVKEGGESESGITIHWVNENYDEGDIIEQFSCDLKPEDDEQEIARKVQILEHKHYPEVIENLVLKSTKNN